jgi:hypothetical protein
MQAHALSDVKQYVGLVVTLDCVEKVDVSSISDEVEVWVDSGCYKRTSVESESSIFLILFIAYILLVKNIVARTSKPLWLESC